MDDQQQYIEIISKNHPNVPVFVIGLDAGALSVISLVYRKPQLIKGVILANTPIKLNKQLPNPLKFVLNKLNDYAPKLPFWPVDTQSHASDPQVVASYEKDPLAYNGWYRVRFYNELVKTNEKVSSNLHHLKTPILVLAGTGTTDINVEASEQLFKSVASKDKSLKKYEGMRSQLFEDKDKQKVIDDVIQWLNAHVA